jgi:hypothetical protein
MVELLRHRQTKEAGTDMFDPKATASHLDSTINDKTQAGRYQTNATEQAARCARG